VVDSRYRKLGIGSFLLSKIRMDNLKSIVVDTPLINEQAIAFYEHIGFVKVNGLTEEFSRNWTWMLKIV
jgi:ribosomal protein S18 acetylase RimI-like enzyme